MNDDSQRWEQIYDTPLCDVPRRYADISSSIYLHELFKQVLRTAPRGSRVLECGIGNGFGAVWLSKRGLIATGMDYSPVLVEKAKLANNILGGSANFYIGDLFDLWDSKPPRYACIYSQGVFEHFNKHEIRSGLAQQVCAADYIIASVPSDSYPWSEFGNERRMTLSTWAHVLAPFDVIELKYYGDPRLGGKEQIMFTLRGQEPSPELLALMYPEADPYPNGITAIIHTRNEEKNIAACLDSLQGVADEFVVCDMESTDSTLAIVANYTDKIIHHPLIANFDSARNCSAMMADFRWTLIVDADERVQPGLAQALRHIVHETTPDFEAMYIPFQHYFANKWM